MVERERECVKLLLRRKSTHRFPTRLRKVGKLEHVGLAEAFTFFFVARIVK